MIATAGLAEQFMQLFSGSQTAHGTYDLSDPIKRADGKIEGRASTKHEATTKDMWERHLSGTGPGLGVVPIREDNSCVFGAIDIDFYAGLDLRLIVSKLQRSRIPLVCCRSKSGGAHLYCFSKTPVSATTMKSKLSEIAAFIGYGTSEIFPKQAQLLVDRGDAGSWISVPYFNGIRGLRYAVDLEGNALSPEAFLMAAGTYAVDEKWFKELMVVGVEFEDGPPCLQALAQIGYPPGTRNEGLYNIGVYLKKSQPDDWENTIEDFNHKYLIPPLTMTEVQGLVKSLKRKDYTYGCAKQPILQHCNSTLCRTRKFGVGSGATNFPVLGGLTKLNTTPPTWFWTVNGIRMELTTSDLQEPRKFQARCIDYLNIIPQIPAAPVWQAMVQHAMDDVTVIDVSVDASPEGQFWEMLESFCLKHPAKNMAEITRGVAFSENGKTYFRLQDLLAFLNSKKFFEFKQTKISSMLKESGAEHHFSVFKGRGVNYWSIREFEKQTEGYDLPQDAKGEKDPF